ncbi:hypothetical protein KC353_g308 [Hortaea werneckii]|nr:hypothetical protein KC353_g308 [Hortaea werneckii]
MGSTRRGATARISQKAKGISSAPKANVLLTWSQNDGGIQHARSYHEFRPRAYELPKSGERRIGTRAFMKATNGQQARVQTFNTTELLELILLRLSAEQLYRMLRVSSRFRQVILASTRIRVKMFLDRSREPKKPWKLMEGVHAGTQFQSFGHRFYLREPLDAPAPMFPALAPHTFTPAILHPVFRNGPWDNVSRREAILAAPWSSLDGTQRWVSAAMLPASLAHSLSRRKNILLVAFTSDPPCFDAVVRVNFELKSGNFSGKKSRHIHSATGLKLRDVCKALRQLTRLGKRDEAIIGKVRREFMLFEPSDIHPVTIQE